jgi:NAD(P)-dependent dehydrogenase (short-subunit alcohol dehydrogenase family)
MTQPNASSRLEGKVAVITGAASGIGEGTARLFASEGARVVLADIQDARGEKLAEELGPRTSFWHTDVSREEDIRGAVNHAVEKFGRLDCMYNNAGFGGVSGPIETTDFEALRQTVDVLLNAAVIGMKQAAPIMKAQGSGSIISTASVAGIGVGYGGHVYSACKAAIIQLTRSVANELGEDGIRVNCIAPGAIPTAIFGKAFGMDQDGAESIIPMLAEGMAKAQPIQRTGAPRDIAEAALWLASDAASFVTGHCLVVDGGLLTGKLWSERMAELGATPA